MEDVTSEGSPGVVDMVKEAVEEEPWLSTVDTILLGAMAMLAIWWYFRDRGDSNDMVPANIHISSSPIPRSSDRTEDGVIGQMKKSGSQIIVFYGSQTGTAEEFASRLAKEATRYGLKGMVADPEEVDMSELAQIAAEAPEGGHLVIFCVATYGEGDPTDNAAEFYQLLQDQDLDLTGLTYCVFALGNRTYEQYNAMGRYIHKRIAELGGTSIHGLGEGDDDQNMEDDFITWKDELWPKVCDVFGVDAAGQEINMRQYRLTELPRDYDNNKVFTGEVTRLKSYLPSRQRPPFDTKNPFMGAVLVSRELHSADSDRNCLHMELDITDSKIRYDAGDHVAVYPTNDPLIAEELCRLLDKDPDTLISLTNMDEFSSKRTPFPCPCTYRTALCNYVDIISPPRAHVIKEFVQYTTDEEEKAKLTLMSSGSEEGRAAYHEWVAKSARTITHILQDLPSCRPPLDYVCELLPRLQARYYSISSSPKVYPTSVHLTAIVLSYTTTTGRTNNGVCTNWLMAQKQKEPKKEEEETKESKKEEETKENDDSDEKKKQEEDVDDRIHRVPLFVRKSQFRLPIKSEVPILMVGPGTGLAPFRAFLQERDAARRKGNTMGKTVLYYGCRHEAVDYLYKDELKAYEASGLLTLHVAFSRDQDDKVYVQHLLAQNAKDVWDLIGVSKGNFYVCGDAKNMAREVNATIIDICRSEGGMTQQQAEDYVKNMLQKRRYSCDIWS